MVLYSLTGTKLSIHAAHDRSRPAIAYGLPAAAAPDPKLVFPPGTG